MNEFLPTWFVHGGPLMWPILICSVLALVVLIEKLWTLRVARILQPAVSRVVKLRTAEGRLREAAAHCRENPGPYSAIAAAALDAAPFGADEVRQAVIDAGRQEGARLERHLPIVRTVAAVSPLLGLLGTVLGMIQVFRVISLSGLGQADRLAGGIQQALLTTAFGLAVAIPALLVHEAFRSKVERLLLVMEREIIELIGHLRDQSRPGSEGAARTADSPGARTADSPGARTAREEA